MYISLSIYEVTTIFQKAFNCNFLLIKTYLKKRNEHVVFTNVENDIVVITKM